MLTKAEREKVYYTRGFRNFCFRAGKANPHYLFYRFVNIIYFCFLFLTWFAVSEYKITWYTELLFFICFSNIIIDYFWGIWLGIIISLRLLKKTQKHQNEKRTCQSEELEEFLQKIINGEVLVLDLGDGFAMYQNKKLILPYYKGFFMIWTIMRNSRSSFLNPRLQFNSLTIMTISLKNNWKKILPLYQRRAKNS